MAVKRHLIKSIINGIHSQKWYTGFDEARKAHQDILDSCSTMDKLAGTFDWSVMACYNIPNGTDHIKMFSAPDTPGH